MGADRGHAGADRGRRLLREFHRTTRALGLDPRALEPTDGQHLAGCDRPCAGLRPGRSAAETDPGRARSHRSLAAGPGTPDRGVVVVCDLGGSGSSITLADAARGFQQIGQTIRFADFSGQQIDQMLLTQVLTDLNQDPEGTTSVGALTRLRDQCRLAKERLSGDTATSVPVQLPGITTDVRLTRAELEGHLRGPLSDLINAIQDTVERNGIHPANITAVASVGGGASIPWSPNNFPSACEYPLSPPRSRSWQLPAEWPCSRLGPTYRHKTPPRCGRSNSPRAMRP